MIKTYLVPTTEEMIKAMKSGEAPSFLHCATCLDGLTNGEVAEKVFDKAFETWHGDDVFDNDGMASNEGYYPDIICDREWFYRKWGE